MKVAKINSAQRAALIGQKYDASGSIYNPVLDGDGDYIITEAEIAATTVAAFSWVKTLPLSNYKTPQINDLYMLQ